MLKKKKWVTMLSFSTVRTNIPFLFFLSSQAQSLQWLQYRIPTCNYQWLTIQQKGTLMAPQILHKVIYGRPDPEPWQKNLLTFQPAILHGYRRYRVRGAAYPGIIPVTTPPTTTSENTNSLSQSEPQEDQTQQQRQQPEEDGSKPSVLGTLVSGLTDGDIYRLDIFEGTEYIRKPVQVRTLKESLDVDQDQQLHKEDANTDEHLRDVLDAAGAEFADEGDEDVNAAAYVYIAGEERLEDKEWDFESFKRDTMAWWVRADVREL